MMVIAPLILWSGAIAFNPTLYEAGITRQSFTENNIDKGIDVASYQCLIGVPFGYKYLIGKEVYFFNEKTKAIYGPFLVTDVESISDSYKMLKYGIVADSNCRFLTHQHGYIIDQPRVFEQSR